MCHPAVEDAGTRMRWRGRGEQVSDLPEESSQPRGSNSAELRKIGERSRCTCLLQAGLDPPQIRGRPISLIHAVRSLQMVDQVIPQVAGRFRETPPRDQLLAIVLGYQRSVHGEIGRDRLQKKVVQ